MAYSVRFFQNRRGEIPVKASISRQDEGTKAKFFHLYDLLRDFGPQLMFPHTKRVTKEISELRIRGKTELRIFYAHIGGAYVLLHAFQKKGQKMPVKELRIAEKRLTEI
ncbi:type II toxin-antitoxin system RelE/ParE family toxin [Candidatus Gottesmanbacteria bacterium]|nr:type II toxin-antitoxin system RelE/ParE family toxin [Candidatus Gottesmanbacteria bacterium]